MVFEQVFQAAPLGLNLLPHRLLFSHPLTGQQSAITCCAVISLATATATSSSSSAAQRGDILILVQPLNNPTNPLSLIQEGSSSHITEAITESHFERHKETLVTAVFPKKVTGVRLTQSPLFQSGDPLGLALTYITHS